MAASLEAEGQKASEQNDDEMLELKNHKAVLLQNELIRIDRLKWIRSNSSSKRRTGSSWQEGKWLLLSLVLRDHKIPAPQRNWISREWRWLERKIRCSPGEIKQRTGWNSKRSGKPHSDNWRSRHRNIKKTRSWNQRNQDTWKRERRRQRRRRKWKKKRRKKKKTKGEAVKGLPELV